MLKALVASIVLILAAGPTSALLCRVWCDPVQAAESGCHPDPSGAVARVATAHPCDALASAASAFIAEAVRTGMTEAADCPSGLLGGLFGVASDPAGPFFDPAFVAATDRRPLVTSLRL